MGLLGERFFFRERLHRLFNEVQFTTGGGGVWVPVVDVYETADAFIVNAELPEVKEQDVSVEVEDSVLRITGERRLLREGRSYHQVERAYGAFARTFTLPSDVDPSMITATLTDGILEVVVPKWAQDAPLRIEIS